MLEGKGSWRCVLLVLFLFVASSRSADNGRALVPPMGWNSWYALGCDNLNETAVHENALIISSEWNGKPSLQSFGYQYVVLDDCWMAYERDIEGNMVADPQKFPTGMKSLSETIQSLGLQLGLYTTPGNITCEGRAATGGHEIEDVQQFVVNWGVRYVKYCMCNTTHEWRLEAYERFYQVVNDTGIPITIENDPPEHPWTWLAPDANLWGIYDIEDNFEAWISRINELQDRNEAPYAGPGHWNMPDMLQIGNGGQTLEEYRSQMSMYSLLAAPLFLGTDLRGLSDETYDLLTNQRVINVNQDKLGIQGQRMSPKDSLGQVWSKKMEDGSYIVVFLNTDPIEPCQLSISWNTLLTFWDDFYFIYGDSYSTSDAIRPYYKDVRAVESSAVTILDIWSGTVIATLETSDPIPSSLLESHQCQMIQITLNEIQATPTETNSQTNWFWVFGLLGIGLLLLILFALAFFVYRYKSSRKYDQME